MLKYNCGIKWIQSVNINDGDKRYSCFLFKDTGAGSQSGCGDAAARSVVIAVRRREVKRYFHRVGFSLLRKSRI